MILLPGTQGITADIAPLLQERYPEERPVIIGAYGESLFSSLEKQFQANQFPVFPSAETAATALSILIERRRILGQTESRQEGKSGSHYFNLGGRLEKAVSSGSRRNGDQKFSRESRCAVSCEAIAQ